MLITTTPDIPGKDYEIIGIVKGCTVQSRNIGHDIGASFKTIIGGEIQGYTEILVANEKSYWSIAPLSLTSKPTSSGRLSEYQF